MSGMNGTERIGPVSLLLSPCFQDTPTFGKREADVAKVAGDQEPSTTDAVSASALTSKLHWEDIDWVRKHAPKCKVLVKGVQVRCSVCILPL